MIMCTEDYTKMQNVVLAMKLSRNSISPLLREVVGLNTTTTVLIEAIIDTLLMPR